MSCEWGWKKMFFEFPREMGFPIREMVYNKEDLYRRILENNGRKNTYISVYSFRRTSNNGTREIPDYNTAIIDKIFFDFDSEDCFIDTLKLHYACVKQDLMHTIIFSGKGFHMYVFVDTSVLSNPKQALMQAQKMFIKKLKLVVDEHVVGDIARITRVPNTFNVRRNRYCIPLMEEDLWKLYPEILDMAKTPRNFFLQLIGRKKFDLTKYDFETPQVEFQTLENGVLEYNGNINLEALHIPNCIKRMLQMKDPAYRDRSKVLMFLMEKGLSDSEIIKFVGVFWSKECIKHVFGFSNGGERQLHYLRKKNYMFPKCEHLIEHGNCTGRCEQYPWAIYC